MRSTLTRVADLSDCALPPFEMPDIDALVEEDLTALLRRRAAVRTHDVVAAGDMVQVRLDGPTDRLTRDRIGLVVGAGLFDAALEQALVGARVGESMQVAHPDGPVTAEILSAQGRELPVATDDLIAELSDGEYATVADYRRARAEAIRQRQREDYLPRAAWDVLLQAISRTEAIIDPADRDELVAAEVERCRELAREEGLVLDEMTADELGVRIGVTSVDDFIARSRAQSRDTLVQMLLGAHYSGIPAADAAVADNNALRSAAWQHARDYVGAITAHEEGISA